MLSYILFIFWGLVSLTQYLCRMHPYCGIWLYVFHSHCWMVFPCINIPESSTILNHSTVDVGLNNFQFLAIRNTATMNILAMPLEIDSFPLSLNLHMYFKVCRVLSNAFLCVFGPGCASRTTQHGQGGYEDKMASYQHSGVCCRVSHWIKICSETR